MESDKVFDLIYNLIIIFRIFFIVFQIQNVFDVLSFSYGRIDDTKWI